MIPFISVITQATGIIIDKVILTRRQVAVHVYIPILFLFLFLVTALLFPFLGTISPVIFEVKNLILFLAMIVTALIWNIFFYRGIQSEKVQEFELILMFQPFFTILLASVFLKGENNINIEIAAFIAAAALVFAQVGKHHFQMSKGAVMMLTAVIFMSIEFVIIRFLLDIFSPVALYAVRTGILFVFFFLFYHPEIRKISNTNTALILGVAALGTVQMVTRFYGFTEYGVVYTSLVLILAPLLIYIFSMVFLHERLKSRTIICGLVILLCVVYATIIGKS